MVGEHLFPNKVFNFSSLIFEKKRKSFYWYRFILTLMWLHASNSYVCMSISIGACIKLTWHWFWIVWSSWLTVSLPIIVINCYHILVKIKSYITSYNFLLLKVLRVDSLLLYLSSGIFYILFLDILDHFIWPGSSCT